MALPSSMALYPALYRLMDPYLMAPPHGPVPHGTASWVRPGTASRVRPGTAWYGLVVPWPWLRPGGTLALATALV